MGNKFILGFCAGMTILNVVWMATASSLGFGIVYGLFAGYFAYRTKQELERA